jgi:putative flippase GtrA
MKNFKLIRNLWLLAGLFWLLSFALKFVDNKSVLSLILNGIICTLFFINAYINHKKIIKNDKS